MSGRHAIVVAGTDTGVGKTVVAAGLARAFAAAGRSVIAVKPVETGCDHADVQREDGARLAAATGQTEPLVALVRLREPLTPALAADREGLTIDFAGLVAELTALAARCDVLVVEGAGGLLSPIRWDRDLSHVARALDARVLVVGFDRLGVINHVHLTVEVLLATRLLPLGVVLSAPAVPDASTGTNADALRRRLAPHRLADRILELPRVADVDEAASALNPVVGWAVEPST